MAFPLCFVITSYICPSFIWHAEYKYTLADSQEQGVFLSIWQIDTFIYNDTK